MTESKSAGSIQASSDRYVVTETHDHKTLKYGDHVVVSATEKCDFFLIIRLDDMTLHEMKDKYGQYVHLARFIGEIP
jgi:hypothetical protein